MQHSLNNPSILQRPQTTTSRRCWYCEQRGQPVIPALIQYNVQPDDDPQDTSEIFVKTHICVDDATCQAGQAALQTPKPQRHFLH